MPEVIQFQRSSRTGWALSCAVVASILLLSAPLRAQEQASALTVGQPVTRDMRGGEQHTYQLSLSAGQYARVVVEQKGIDVVLALSDADGKPIVGEVDNT